MVDLRPPEELKAAHQEELKRLELVRIANQKRRLAVALLTGLIAAAVACAVPMVTGGGSLLLIVCVVLFGIVWSVAVQFLAVNHLISCVVFSLPCIIADGLMDLRPDLFWWLALVIAGTVIGLVNDTYRRHIGDLP
jgi:hypothetical protein